MSEEIGELESIIIDLEDLEQDYRLRNESMSNPYIQKVVYDIFKKENDRVKLLMETKANELIKLIKEL